MNKLYFVVPVYNVEKYLKRCTDSLLRQSYKDCQIILVDDGSTDASGRICDEYAKAHCNINVIHQKNGGLSAARNAGIEYCLKNSSGDDYITFIDSDDFISEEYGEELINISKRYNAPVVQCQYEKGSGDNFSEKNIKATEYSVNSADALLGYELKSQATPKMYRLNLFDDIRFPLGVINEDEFTTYKVVYKAGIVAFTSKVLYYYYQHTGSIMDTIAKKLKDNPHRNDWLAAYMDRYLYFEEKHEHELMEKTLEKICTDIILRYSEQMMLQSEDRDTALINGEYIRTYRYFYKQMIKRRGMPVKRRFMHMMFYYFPISSYIAGRFVNLRK